MAMNLSIITKEDLNEAGKLKKRKQYEEEERKKQIFNAKQRLYGLDLNSLERQIVEKAKVKQMKDEYDLRYEQQSEMIQKLIHNRELELRQHKRDVEVDINNYRCNFQRIDKRQEFDLNHPESIKKFQPVRIADDDFGLGYSSAQIFNGEDLGYHERKQKQRIQQRAWLDQQILEKERNKEYRLNDEKVLQNSIKSRDKYLEAMLHSERKVSHDIVDSIRKYNCQLAKQKREECWHKKQEKNEDNMAEIYNMMTSDMLTENLDVAQSKLNPNKKIAYLYRGMSPEELKIFRREQHQQMLDKKKIQTEQKLMDKQWEQYAINMNRQLTLESLQMQLKKQDEFKKITEINNVLAKQQQAQNEQNNKILSKNEISTEFYKQFNKTSR